MLACASDNLRPFAFRASVIITHIHITHVTCLFSTNREYHHNPKPLLPVSAAKTFKVFDFCFWPARGVFSRYFCSLRNLNKVCNTSRPVNDLLLCLLSKLNNVEIAHQPWISLTMTQTWNWNCLRDYSWGSCSEFRCLASTVTHDFNSLCFFFSSRSAV